MRIRTSSRAICRAVLVSGLLFVVAHAATAQPAADAAAASPWKPWTEPSTFELGDIFELEWANDPQISPDGSRVVYQRSFMDRMADRRRSNLWVVNTAGDAASHQPLTTGMVNHASPRWSPDGQRLLYVATDPSAAGGAQLWVRWMESGRTARLTQLSTSPSGLAWSPDGRTIAFTRFVESESKPMASLPSKPEGAQWAEPAVVIEELIYRSDGAGYLSQGHRQLFVVSAEGGTPRQVTKGDFDVSGTPVWTRDGSALLFGSNRNEDWRYDPVDGEIYRVDVATGEVTAFTDRNGPDGQPALSPDGRRLAWVGFDDRVQGYQISRLSVADVEADGRLGESRILAGDLDRSISSPTWSADGKGLFFTFTDQGNGKIGFVELASDRVEVVAENRGGTSLGRPYGGGSFSVANDGTLAFNFTRPDHPADVAVVRGGSTQRLTRLNDDLFGHKKLGEVEEMWVESSHDGRRIHGWIVKPPGFEAGEKYPLVLEIHGGPFADYGDRFAAEVQLYAAAGYVVLYMNPRGSSSYGEEFGNLIHHAYPSYDFDDLMTGIDEVIRRGYVDPDQLFVTGGSGGGVLTAWIVGHTDRFRAAVVAKPVINWTSFVLTADVAPFFWKYWFPGFPWDEPENYRRRSPLSYVGNVTTPTMLLTGEADYRTPIAESEQFYQALKLRRVDSALVRIPDASHGITARPSQFMTKVAHVLAWFERYR
ncbi:MAG: S9 family peptidase [Thermoanaerobaculia bacterium]|nr:S9 family peptidase [Thermoanaerobaculia bacterium]